MPGIKLAEPVRIKYTSVQNFLAVVNQHYDQLRQYNTENQLLEFSGVSHADFALLSADSTRPCKSAKFHYLPNCQILRVKIMPGWDHEILIALLRDLIESQLRSMNVKHEVITLGSPKNVFGSWVKEPDLCWSLETSCSQPRCIVEIGTSETSRQLSVDAHGWLESPHSSAKAVITIAFKYIDAEKAPNPLTISLWEPVDRISNVDTRRSPLTTTRTAALDVWNVAGTLTVTGFRVVKDEEEEDIQMTTNELRLPFDLFIGRPASNEGEGDIVLTEVMVIGLVRKLLECRRQYRISG
ncbi:unnamed protein product [Penicillium camemberti]|uniref:Str. FM013 n=1 Tax=Penicillium camemberti (strain FM 013) TaxID=1429867 RepID=A0A0G4NUV6_PENC3|nr:unnamed protein product [Penicillium camemberti]